MSALSQERRRFALVLHYLDNRSTITRAQLEQMERALEAEFERENQARRDKWAQKRREQEAH